MHIGSQEANFITIEIRVFRRSEDLSAERADIIRRYRVNPLGYCVDALIHHIANPIAGIIRLRHYTRYYHCQVNRQSHTIDGLLISQVMPEQPLCDFHRH